MDMKTSGNPLRVDLLDNFGWRQSARKEEEGEKNQHNSWVNLPRRIALWAPAVSTSPLDDV